MKKYFFMFLVLLIFTGPAPERAAAQIPLGGSAVTGFNRPYQPLMSYLSIMNWCRYTSRISVYLPFDFYYDGVNTRYITMSGSGLIKLGTGSWWTTTPYKNRTTRTGDEYLWRSSVNRLYGGYVFALFAELSPTVLNYQMLYNVIGTAPNRIAVFEFRNASWIQADQRFNTSFNFQILLYETSNNIEIHYGPMDRGTADCGWFTPVSSSYSGMIGFQGYNAGSPLSDEYVNIDPNGNGNMNNGKWERGTPGAPLSRGYSYYETVRTNADFDCIQNGIGIRLAYSPIITMSQPLAGANLIRGSIYGNGTADMTGNGDNQRPAAQIANISGGATMQRRIAGPVTFPPHPNYKVIYDATDVFQDNTLSYFTTPTAGAQFNSAFYNVAPFGGAFDLATHASSIAGGLYTVSDVIRYNNTDFTSDYKINIANEWDLQADKIIAPKPLKEMLYPVNSSVPVKVRFINKGINNIGNFFGIVKIYNSSNDLVYGDSVYWQAKLPGEILKMNDEIILDFKLWNPVASGIGDYKVKVYGYTAADQELYNNYLPLAGQPDFIIRIAPETEIGALSILEPNNTDEFGGKVDYYTGRPIQPRVRYKNNGINDVSDVPTNLTIKYLATNEEVFRLNNIKIPSISAGIAYNTYDLLYDYFTPQAPGEYEITATVNAPDDDIDNNNTVKIKFNVLNALSGTYTIGPGKNTGNKAADSAYNSRNFTSIQDAVDKLYLTGVSGPVVFELNSGNFTVGNYEPDRPALDLRSKIEGISPVNTVTFRPSASFSTAEGAVTINLNSGSGVGVLFGQSLQVNNPYAIINTIPPAMRKNYANSAGYIVFNGGIRNALKFVLNTDSKWNAVFMLCQGASNITVENCIITTSNSTTAWRNYRLPGIMFNEPVFSFETDVNTQGFNSYSYSAGIVLRSVSPQDYYNLEPEPANVFSMQNTYKLDTLVNSGNIIKSNKISGFAYGIVSMGPGQLIQAGKGTKARFYNKNNIFASNHIYNISKAGIFMGFNENSTVSGNRISHIATSITGYDSGNDIGGIMLGGEFTSNYSGMNNIDIIIDGNEIYNAGSAMNDAGSHNWIYGIKAEQSLNNYGTKVFPDKQENITIINNIVWGLKPAASNINTACIALLTERKRGESDWTAKMLTPQNLSYFSRNDKVYNNTMVVGDDADNTTKGVRAAAFIQNTKYCDFRNNAIALKDKNDFGNGNIYTGIYFQGFADEAAGGIHSNSNIFGIAAGTDIPSLIRVATIDDNSNILYQSGRDEFTALNHWQVFAGQDLSSAIYDFTAELTNPLPEDYASKLRISSQPDWPKGSKLNNRGEKMTSVLRDIDGNARGMMGQNYDIGAVEFPGILYQKDAEISSIVQPASYKSITGPFADAEYIMTEAPVDVCIQAMNNGTLGINGLIATVKIYREDPQNPGNFEITPDLEETAIINLESAESSRISFKLNDLTGEDFYPVAYEDWNKKYEGTDHDPDKLYIIPERFSSMACNVSPLYKISISLQSDEDNQNNTSEKIVRFYIKRSILNMVISAENSCYKAEAGAGSDILAGRRNYDSLVAGLKRMGWMNYWNQAGELKELVQFYDVFERTSWEPKSVNYSMYNTILWSDADNNVLTREEKAGISKYLQSGNANTKKNLVACSEEMARINYSGSQKWVNDILRVKFEAGYPYDPNGGNEYSSQDSPSNYLTGVALSKGTKHDILRTLCTVPDPGPVPALVGLYTEGDGLTRAALAYNESSVICPLPKEISAGSATSSINKNIIYVGIDWRHFGDIETILRGIVDYLDKNGSSIVPVELTSFSAEQIDRRIALTWETASENNSFMFEVEKSELNSSDNAKFHKIAESKACGKSTKPVFYGPVWDGETDYGKTYSYRLKIFDADGKYEFSNIVSVTIDDLTGFALGDILPNPAANVCSFGFTIETDTYVEISVFGLSGKKVMSIAGETLPAGSYTRNIDISNLEQGTYSIVMASGGKSIMKQLKVVK